MKHSSENKECRKTIHDAFYDHSVCGYSDCTCPEVKNEPCFFCKEVMNCSDMADSLAYALSAKKGGVVKEGMTEKFGWVMKQIEEHKLSMNNGLIYQQPEVKETMTFSVDQDVLAKMKEDITPDEITKTLWCIERMLNGSYKSPEHKKADILTYLKSKLNKL